MKRFLWLLGGVVLLLFCWGCSRGFLSSGTASRRYVDTAMGTVVHQTIYARDEKAGEAFSEKAMEVLNGLEGNLLSWRLEGSEVYRLNASGGGEKGMALSEELWGVLRKCQELYRDSRGTFDVTMGAVVRLWNIDQWAAGEQAGEFRPPEAGELERAIGACGSDRLKLSEGETNRAFLPRGMQIDLGAVGKGLALNEILELLQQDPRIDAAVISVGGSVLTYGSKPDGSSWKVAIPNPDDTGVNVGILVLEGQWCVSTSGDYERYVEAAGVRYHHILDPRTGCPAGSGVRSVTVLSKDGFDSDGLSTACFILGPEEGMALAQSYGAEALFVMEGGEIVMSQGMEAYFVETGKDF